MVQNIITRTDKRTSEGYLVDMHIHTNHSHDCAITLEETLSDLVGKINALFITDHDIIANYTLENLEAYEIKYQIKVHTKSVEISTLHGDILGYGITAVPTSHLEPEEVIDIIHSEKGIAVAAHPFDILGVGELVYELNFDAIEINGLRSKLLNQRAKEAADILGLPCIGGSDSHNLYSIGTCVTQFEKSVNTIEDIIKQIKLGKCNPIFLK